MIRPLSFFMGSEKKYGGASRKDFVRTQIPLAENMTSVVILLLLVGIGVAVAIKGKHFDPNLYSVRNGSLDATAAAVVGKSVTAPTAPGAVASSSAVASDQAVTAVQPVAASAKPAASTESEGGAESSGTAAPAATGVAMEIALAGIKPMSATEFYNSDNLFEKIDGRAPAYQGFNFQQLRCRSFSVLAAAGSYVDVYEYRFDNPVDAFGMFALERDPKGKPTDFAADGYSGELGYYFRQGAVYVQILASDQKPETVAMSTAIAQDRAKQLPVDDTGLASRRELPAAGMIANSIGFIAENAQGQGSLKNVFQAKYTFDGAELPFFIMVAPADETAAAWKSFQDFCARFGKVEQLPDVNGGKVFRTQLFGKWKVVYQRNNQLGGVFDAADGDKARTFVEKYLQGEIK
jgi:hypothetical protein